LFVTGYNDAGDWRLLKYLAGLAIVATATIYGGVMLLEAPTPEEMAAYQRKVLEKSKTLSADRKYGNCVLAARGSGARLTCAATAAGQQRTAFILLCSDSGDVVVMFRDGGQADAGKYMDVVWLFEGGKEWKGRWRYSRSEARPREKWVFWKFLRELENAKGFVHIRFGATSGRIPLHSLRNALADFKHDCPVLD
jgi:hypothetical protein